MKSFDFYFNLIYKYYGNKTAARSKVPLIAHIVEGVNVLKGINASDEAIKAFMIHPIFQSDEVIGKYEYIHAIDPHIMMLVMEYRSIANLCLPKQNIKYSMEIKLSKLKDVNDMLIADKVQNYKDFLAYHKSSHEKSNELNNYFYLWLKRLNVNFEELVKYCYNTAVTLRVKNNDKYLLLNRFNHDRTYVGSCHPGGKVDYPETLFEALKREVKEEIGFEVNTNKVKFFDVFFAQTKKGIKTVFTFDTEENVTVNLNTDEFESYKWVDENEWKEFWNSDIEVDYENHNFYAVDLDNTILYDNWPGFGEFIPGAIEGLKKIIDNPKNHIIIWTMRPSHQHKEIIEILKEQGIRILGVNEHLLQHEWTDSPKLYADIFIDDRNIDSITKGKIFKW